MSKKIVYLLGTIAVAVFFLAPALYSYTGMTHIYEDAFPKKERPASVFPHDEHTDVYAYEYDLEELKECYYCHHFDGPDQEHTDDSVGIPCSDCHPVETDDPDTTPLMQAYHIQCKSCHQDEKAGPVACGECHVR
ncbi:acidic tetraheme cytochrome c3 TmcA [Desulfonatronospira sp.]|uniref:acidic tetraheme cytochrome c3 TmcA n=1 Tax=Desulfonatronospira sp. TaxID=1962951 RepID=UPI0025C36022|nr:cytochrome c3 family protein [Desulfonatronospira sp.]